MTRLPFIYKCLYIDRPGVSLPINPLPPKPPPTHPFPPLFVFSVHYQVLVSAICELQDTDLSRYRKYANYNAEIENRFVWISTRMKFCDVLAGHTGKVGTNGTHTLGGVK